MADLDLLISQWHDAPRLRALLQIWLDVLEEEIEVPLARLDAMRSLDEAEGIYLDYLGDRLGVSRPFVLSSAETLARFDQTDTGFEQGRFSALASLESREPLNDADYRKMLKARAEYDERSGAGTQAVMQRALRHIDDSAVVIDNHDMTFTVVALNHALIRLADERGALPRPAGVRMLFDEHTPLLVGSGGVQVTSGNWTVSSGVAAV